MFLDGHSASADVWQYYLVQKIIWSEASCSASTGIWRYCSAEIILYRVLVLWLTEIVFWEMFRRDSFASAELYF